MSIYSISKTIFSKETILKTIYLLQENFDINLSEDENNFIISVENKNATTIFDWHEFNKRIQEQQLRENLACQFGTLRQTIYEHAFMHFKD